MKHTFLIVLIFVFALTLAPLSTNAADQPERQDATQKEDALSKENFIDREIDEAWRASDPSGKEQKKPMTQEELDKMHKEQEETASDILLY